MSLTVRRIQVVALVVVATSLGVFASARSDDAPDKKQPPAAAKAPDNKAPEKVDRYAVPDGGVDELLAFMNKLRQYRPKSRQDYITHMMKSGDALRTAAEKILDLKPAEDTEAHQVATLVLLQQRINTVGRVNAKQRKEIIDAVRERVTAVKPKDLGDEQISLMMMLAQGLERSGKDKAAAEVYKEFGELLAQSDDQRFAGLGRLMEGSARRINLLGNEMELKGTTMDGKPFDWESYRGKVVLIDFWATWCGPCRAEMPNVRSNYDKYHDKGFDVVGISLDRDREALEKFLATEKPPWVTLNEEGADRDPNAEYYGIMGIPTVILVDREGKVVSLNARGPELGRLLEKLLGPPSAASAPSAESDS